MIAAVAFLSVFGYLNSVAAISSHYVVSVDMTIDAGSEDFITSALKEARSLEADHFVLILNTFGGEGKKMDNIIGAISDYQSAGGTFITLIAPAGRHAFSAGAYIAQASDKIYMTSGTAIGAATPVIAGIPSQELNTTLTKSINAFKSYMESLATHFGRNATAAGLMVSKGHSYTAEEALRFHVIDALLNSTSVSDALTAIGVPPATEIRTPGIRANFLSILADPNLSGLLFLLGVFAILADLSHPTAILSVVGAVAIIFALVGLGVFGAPILSILLMFVGALFILFELVTGHGVSAVLGVGIFAVGFLLVFATPPPPPQLPPGVLPDVNFIGIGIITYAILALVGGGVVVGSVYLYRLRKELTNKTSQFDAIHMIGREGRVTSEVKAGRFGTANIGSEDWTVTSSQDLLEGTVVKVKEVQGLKLVVERKED